MLLPIKSPAVFAVFLENAIFKTVLNVSVVDYLA